MDHTEAQSERGDASAAEATVSSTQEMPRIFSLRSTLAIAFSITNTWIGYSATFVPPLLAGGGPAVVFCLVLACFACTVLALGLAELSSAFPSSGGQYQYAPLLPMVCACARLYVLALPIFKTTNRRLQLRIHGFDREVQSPRGIYRWLDQHLR